MVATEGGGRLALVGGTLIDGSGDPPLPDSVVLIEGATIRQAGPRASVEVPGGAAVIEITGKTVLPGLMDLHLHLRMGASDPLRLGVGAVPSHLDTALTMIGIRGFARARRALEMGFTTLRDVGDVGYLGVSLRDAIGAGIVEGPRLVACGENFTATGGSGDHEPPWLMRVDVPSRVADGVEGVRRAVRRQVKAGTDWIKFFATGTFGRPAITQDYTDEEIWAIVDEAHAKGRRVCAHCCFARGTLAAVRAGVDSVEHGTELTDAIIELMLENGTFLVPTIYIFHALHQRGAEVGLAPALVERAGVMLEQHVASFRRAMAAGVKIAMGSDIGSPVSPHGTSACELELMVRYGMAPMDAIVAATSRAAECLRLDDRLGRIAPGMLADVVVVDGDPLADITVLQRKENIALVLKEGVICAPPAGHAGM